MESFSSVKNCKAAMMSFFSITNFKSRKKVTESFSSGHASLYFHDAEIS